MAVAGDHRSPRADVVDVALALDVPEMRAGRAGEEQRRAADRAERAHRRVDAARDQLACARKQVFILHANSFAYALARAAMSGASKRSEITASRSAPAAMSC